MSDEPPVGRTRLSVWDRDPRKVLDYWQATLEETLAVDVAAHAMLAFEAAATKRRTSGDRQAVTGESILDRLDVSTARWAALATAAIYRAEQLRGFPCVLDYQKRRRATTQARWRAAHPRRAA